MNVGPLIALLEGVRQTGDGRWVAKCPAHADKSPSLSIRATSDGTVLLHCFAGCGAAEVVHAVGLELRDLFPEKPRDVLPEDRRVAREAFKRGSWIAALGVLSREATVLLIAASDVSKGKPLNHADDARLSLAVQRISEARAVLT